MNMTTSLSLLLVVTLVSSFFAALMFAYKGKIVKLLAGCAYVGFYSGLFYSSLKNADGQQSLLLGMLIISFLIGVAVFAAKKLIQKLHSEHILDEFE